MFAPVWDGGRFIPIFQIVHAMPHAVELAGRVGVHRPGRRFCVPDPKGHSVSDAIDCKSGRWRPQSLTATVRTGTHGMRRQPVRDGPTELSLPRRGR